MLTLLDVYKFIDDFEESGKNIASVAAQTGTGKSTMFPDGFYRRDKNIFVVQPTITASTGLAKHMKKFIPEESIGTAVEGNINYRNEKLYLGNTDTTAVVYCTAGHLRNILLKFSENKKPSKFIDYIFLDEAHTGDLQYDGIMYLYAYLIRMIESSDDPTLGLPKLMLITATPGIYPFKPSEIYEANYVNSQSLPVEVKYNAKNYVNLNGKDYKELFDDVTRVVIDEHKATPVANDKTDAWLIFCPGKKEILGIVDELRKKTHGTIIIPLYSSMSDDTEIQYDITPPLGIRKIIVSTNVAEASITIDGLSYVFDTLVEKTTMKNKNGATMLVSMNISKSSAQQRKGRSGRTVKGKCYRMCTEEFFNNLEKVKKREIERISPDGLILDLLSRKLEIEEVIFDGAISISTIKEAKTRLSTIGLLTDDMTSITLAGEWIKKTPLSPRGGMFFWLWSKYSEYNPFIGAVMTAILETHNGGYFYLGDNDPTIDKILDKKFLPIINEFKECDKKSSFVFNIMLIMYIISSFKSIEIPSQELRYYCQNNNLNNAKIKECLKLIKQLSSKGNKSIIIGNFDVEYEIEKAEPFVYQCFSDLSYNINSKRHKIKTEIDSLLGIKDKISNSSIIIPLSSFDTEYKTFVSMYHTISKKPQFKISLKKEENDLLKVTF